MLSDLLEALMILVRLPATNVLIAGVAAMLGFVLGWRYIPDLLEALPLWAPHSQLHSLFRGLLTIAFAVLLGAVAANLVAGFRQV